MSHPVAPRLLGVALITAIVCAVPTRTSAHPAPVTSSAPQSMLAFDTHLVGTTRDGLATGRGAIPAVGTTARVTKIGGKCLGISKGGICITAVSPKSGDPAAGVTAVKVTFSSAVRHGTIAVELLPSPLSSGAHYIKVQQAFAGRMVTIAAKSALAAGKYTLFVAATYASGGGAYVYNNITLT